MFGIFIYQILWVGIMVSVTRLYAYTSGILCTNFVGCSLVGLLEWGVGVGRFNMVWFGVVVGGGLGGGVGVVVLWKQARNGGGMGILS